MPMSEMGRLIGSLRQKTAESYSESNNQVRFHTARVIRVEGSRSRPSMYFRCSPKADSHFDALAADALSHKRTHAPQRTSGRALSDAFCLFDERLDDIARAFHKQFGCGIERAAFEGHKPNRPWRNRQVHRQDLHRSTQETQHRARKYRKKGSACEQPKMHVRGPGCYSVRGKWYPDGAKRFAKNRGR